ncbi:MAG: AAA family ATPase [Bacillota bacterium]|nr:AAA family ATPase [Bacillota bacterium]
MGNANIDETLSKAGGYISEITFNNGKSIPIKQNEILVFVGPNNVGKSQALKDIYTLCEAEQPTIIIKNIKVIKSNIGLVYDLLNQITQANKRTDRIEYRGYRFNFDSKVLELSHEFSTFNSEREVFVTYLDTEQRLLICNPADAIIRDEPKRHPIHYVAYDQKCRKNLSENFKRAFGKSIYPNLLYGKIIPLVFGDRVNIINSLEDSTEYVQEYGEMLLKYKQIHQQGDGVRSFTGILLSLMIYYYCVFLIDEPESFLHPPQANIMGRIIGETLKSDQQAFISTHSQDIIKGLLDVCPDRVKIIRITRKDDENSFSILNNDDMKTIWSDSLLRHSETMNGMFHNSVVLCESDSDCKMYSIINSFLKEEEKRYNETLFLHCGGKQRMYKVIKALKLLSLNIKVVVDFDALNDKDIFRRIVESSGGTWDLFEKDYNIFISNIDNAKKDREKTEVLKNIKKVLDANTEKYINKNDVQYIQDILKPAKEWEELKKNGISAIPSGDATTAYKRLDESLKQQGIFIVPCGELEYFIKEIGKHGPEWVNSVLEQYPNLSDGVYKKIKEFVSSFGI